MPKMRAAGSKPSFLFPVVLMAAAGACCSCAALGPSCDTSDDGNPANHYLQGTTSGGIYMSSPWTGPLLNFPGGKRYQLYHGLGCTPRDIAIWVSFGESGLTDGTMAPSAGNMSEIQEVTDQFIRIKNDTCSDMYVLVTASCGAASSADAGTGDGGTDADSSTGDAAVD